MARDGRKLMARVTRNSALGALPRQQPGARAVCVCLPSHRRGAALTLVARDAQRLAALPVPGARYTADLRSPGACAEAVRRATTEMGGLDVLINAVGIVAFGAVSQTPAEAMEELLRTNTLVAMMLAGYGFPVIRPGGAIVNISGVIAKRNLPGIAAYGASKTALRAFDEALAREGRRVDVRVIDARPPHTETGLGARAIAGTAPRLGAGIPPIRVARAVCDALEQGSEDLPSSAF